MDESKQEMLKVLGRNIKKMRESRNMSLDELARKCGYTSDNARSSMQKIESGKSDIPASKLKQLALALNVSVSDLLKHSSEQTIALHSTDELFEKEYGHTAYNAMKSFLKLDTIDQAKITERIDTLLESDKYNKEKELLNA